MEEGKIPATESTVVESNLAVVQEQEKIGLLQQFPQTPQAYIGEALEKEAEKQSAQKIAVRVKAEAQKGRDEMDILTVPEEIKEKTVKGIDPDVKEDEMKVKEKEKAQEIEEEEERPDEEKMRRWKEKRNYPWDNDNETWLTERLHEPRTEKLGGRSALQNHLLVCQETCGGEKFLAIGMLPYWKDKDSPIRLEQEMTEVEYRLGHKEEEALHKLLDDELREGIIVKVRRDQVKFISPVFPVPKPNGEWRKVTDMRLVNEEQQVITCRMDGTQTVQEISIEGDLATSLDIKNAFNHIRVNDSYSPYLGFVHRGEFYVYKAMPFGCRHSPRVFMRALGYPLRYIRAHWEVRIVAYMDDLLLLHQDRDYLRKATLQIALYLASLGWTLSLGKCDFTPQHAIKYLGWRWAFDTLTLKMTPEMRKSLLFRVRQWIEKAVRRERVSCRRLGSLIGCLNFLRCQIPRASLYLSTLHAALTRGVNSSGWNGYITLEPQIASELQFWWRNISYNTPFSYRVREPQATLTTDASKRGWGAELEIGSQSLISFGSYSMIEGSDSSNLRETRAVLRALLYFREALIANAIHSLTIRTDNMVTVYNLQRQGSSKHLLNETRQIFSILLKLDIRIRIMHVPGVQNTLADALSRMDLVGDYELKMTTYQEAINVLQVQPTVDLFATSSNHKCERFVALPGLRSEGAIALDAFQASWSGETPYVFPPVQIIPKVLQKLRLEVDEALMVVPEWTSRPWWNLFQMHVVQQVRLGRSTEVLQRGPTMTTERAELPPGYLVMARLSFKQ